MGHFLDAGGEDNGPSFLNSSYFGLFCIVFILISANFLLNLFVGVIALNYSIVESKIKNKDLS